MVASITMSATITTGINSTIEVNGVNAQVHANVPARGDVTFILLPTETYHVHLHDANGRLVAAMRLIIPGTTGNSRINGGSGGSGGSGRVVPQARKSTRGSSRLRGTRPVPCGFRGLRRRRAEDGQSSREDEASGLPPNMAIRTMDQSPPRSPSPSSDDGDASGDGTTR